MIVNLVSMLKNIRYSNRMKFYINVGFQLKLLIFMLGFNIIFDLPYRLDIIMAHDDNTFNTIVKN